MLLSYAYALECPKYECRQLRSNVCAEIYSNMIVVNSDGCNLDSSCSFYELGTWVYTNYRIPGDFKCTTYYYPDYNSTYSGHSSQDSYDTEPDFTPNYNYTVNPEVNSSNNPSSDLENLDYSYQPYYPYSNSSEEEEYIAEFTVPCKYKDLRNLAEGKHPKLCESDEDCELQDGTLATCKCAWDGNRYCVPDKYDDLWDPFWASCKKEGKMYYWDEFNWNSSVDKFIWINSMTIEDEICASFAF
jgi:hypothetical protein